MGRIEEAGLDEPLDRCSCWWGSLRCPNPPSFIIIATMETTVFAIMCSPHRIGFEQDFGKSEDHHRVEPYSLELAIKLRDQAKLEGAK